jgi:hypothetical protein
LASILRLKVENLLNTLSGEDMMAASDPFLEAEPPEQCPQIVEWDAGIRRPAQYSRQNRISHTSLTGPTLFRRTQSIPGNKCTGQFRRLPLDLRRIPDGSMGLPGPAPYVQRPRSLKIYLA